MAVDVAELGFKVDSSGIKSGYLELDKLEKASKKTETTTERLEKSIEGMGSAMRRQTQHIDVQRGSIVDLTNRMRVLQESRDRFADPSIIQRYNRTIDRLAAQRSKLESFGRTAGSAFGRTTTGARQTTSAVIDLGRIIQDAPFGAMGVTNNIDPFVNSFGRLKAELGSTGAAAKALIKGTFMGPTGLMFLLGSVLPTALLLSSDGFNLFTDSAEEAEDKLKTLKDTTEAYIDNVTRLQGRTSFDPLGSESLSRQLTATRQLREELDSLYTLQQRQAELERTIFTLRQAGTRDGLEGVLITQQDALRGVNTELERQREIYGPLTELGKEYLDEKIAQQEAELAYQRALRQLNPALEFQAALNTDLMRAIRDVKLGLEGSEPAIRNLITSYDQQITTVREAISAHKGEAAELETLKQILFTLTQARRDATGVLSEQEKGIEGINKDLERQVEAFLALRTGAALYLDELRSVPDVNIVDPKDFLSPNTGAIEDLEKEFEVIENMHAVFGDFNLHEAKLQAVEQQMMNLLENGVKPNDVAMQGLIQQYNDLAVKAEQAANRGREGMDLLKDGIMGVAQPMESFLGSSITEMMFFQEETIRVRNEFGEWEEQTITLGDRLTDMFDGFLQQLFQATTQLLIIRPLMNSIFGGLLDTGSGGGSQDFEIITGMAGTSSYHGNVFSEGRVKQFAQGGAFTNSIVREPTLFDMGLMGEGGRDEAIMPLMRTKNGDLGVKAEGGGGDVNIEINNYSGQEVQVDERPNGSGGVDIELTIGNVMKSMHDSGKMDATMKRNYRIRRGG